MKLQVVAVAASLAFGLMGAAAQAAYIIDVSQSGTSVDIVGQGSIDINGLSYYGSIYDGFVPNSIIPNIGRVIFGGGSLEGFYYASGPSTIGPGSNTFASSGSGNAFSFSAAYRYIGVPDGYVSGQPLGISTLVFDMTTIAKLGFDQGSYRYTWGSGASADSLTINVGLSSVPLPASAPLFGAALLGLSGLGYSAKRRTKAAA